MFFFNKVFANVFDIHLFIGIKVKLSFNKQNNYEHNYFRWVPCTSQ